MWVTLIEMEESTAQMVEGVHRMNVAWTRLQAGLAARKKAITEKKP